MGSRVLLVEDDEVVRASIVRALRARGVGVDPFGSPQAALVAVQGGSAWSRALIALDLPGMDGATLAEKILSFLPEIEITFATRGVDAAILCRAHGLGAVIWKPLGLGPLCERFSSSTRRSGVVARRGVAIQPADEVKDVAGGSRKG